MYNQAASFKLPSISYNKQELQEIVEELPVAAEILVQIDNYLNKLETHFLAIKRYQNKVNPSNFYQAMKTELLEIQGIAATLYEFTKLYHSTFPNTLKQKILNWIEPLEKELAKLLEMPPDDRATLELKTKHLYAEQSLVSREPQLQQQLMRHLTSLKQLLQSNAGTPAPRCYISYAWPSKEYKEQEYWVQPFLYVLYDHLTAAGLRVVMDIRDNNPGDSIYRFMQQYSEGNYIILVGTKSLLQKHYSETAHAVQTELSIILNRFEQDQRQFGQSRIYPMLISSTMKTSYPERYQMYSTVRDARDQGYIGTLKKLIDWFFPTLQSETQAEYLNLWKAFYSECPGLSKDNVVQVEAEIALNYHRQRLDLLRQDIKYQCVHAQETTKHSKAVTAGMVGVLLDSQGNDPKILYAEYGNKFQFPTFNSNYIERNALSNRIKQHFSQHERQILTLTAHGLGGMGKTELAQDYFLYPPRPYELRAWFHVKEGKEYLYQQYVDLAEKNGIRFYEKQPVEEKAQRVKQWLEAQKNCLLVYDNVLDAEVLEGLLPAQGKHHILITSRNEVDWQVDQRLDVDIMEEHEAIELIVKITGDNESKEMLQLLVNTLGRLPLALAQAAAYISVKSLSIDKYLELYHQYQSKLLSDITKRSPKHEPVWITFDMNFEALETECPVALVLLKQVSWISTLVPEILLKAILEIAKGYCDNTEDSNLLWGDVTEFLRRYSLMKIDVAQHQASIHPLLQDILRNKQKEEEQLKLRTDLCSVLDKQVKVNDSRDSALDRVLLPHVETLYQHSRSFFRLLKTHDVQEAKKCYKLIPEGLNNIYLHLGLDKKNVDFLEARLFIALKSYGEGSIEVATVQQNLAVTLDRLGNYVGAKALYEKALITKIAYYHTEAHESVAGTQQNLAITLERLGDYVGAKVLNEKALETMIAHYHSETHVIVAETQQNLANTLARLRDYMGAKTMYEKSLATIIVHYQTEVHVRVAESQQNLAAALTRLRDYTGAKAMYEKSLATMIVHYHTEMHVGVATTQYNLATLLHQLGNFSEAYLLLEKCENTFQTQFCGAQYLERCRKLKKHIKSYLEQHNSDTSRNTLQDTQCYRSALSFYGTSEPDQAIRRAAGKGDYENLATLLERQPELIDTIDTKPSQGWTALHWAVKNNRFQCIAELLSRGARYDIADKSLQSVTVIDLCLEKANLEIIKIFKEHLIKKYIKTGDDAGRAFRNAVNKGDLNATKLLAKEISSINEAGLESGQTALHRAAINKDLKLVQFLIGAGADVSLEDKKGKRAVDYVKNNEELECLLSGLRNAPAVR